MVGTGKVVTNWHSFNQFQIGRQWWGKLKKHQPVQFGRCYSLWLGRFEMSETQEDAISLIVKIKDDQKQECGAWPTQKKRRERERDCYSNRVVFVDSTFCFHFSFCNFIKL
jgi:hypothetical protein